mmetsp:Transcript_31828/g.51540  ORF Transcript_31828/g.51540 Transcript_31828/m.51540 type:complete len:344 (-) Transcript_31828:1287-2318(-)
MALISDGMFEDLKEIAENSAFMEAVKKPQVSDEMWKRVPKFENCMDLEKFLREQKQLNFETVFNKSTGFYMLKCFLIANQAVDKAIFLRDVTKFHKVRFKSARQRVAIAIWERFVNDDSKFSFPPDSSVFDLIQHRDISYYRKEESSKKKSRSRLEKERKESMLDYGKMNAVGVYGPAVENARQMIMDEKFSQTMFDEVVEEVRSDLLLGIFPRFERSEFYKRYIKCCAATRVSKLGSKLPGAKVDLKDFEVFRVLGRGGFGSVKACRKRNCGNLYAMKIINKKRVKVKKALRNVMEERHVLVKISGSPFITNLKYALQDEEDLFFIMDLMYSIPTLIYANLW